MTHADRQVALAIGIGSAHGDDRAGWEVIDRLSEKDSSSMQLRKAAVPHDILDWLQQETYTHLVDACSDGATEVRRYEVSQDATDSLLISLAASTPKAIDLELSALRSGSSHQFDLLSTLRLAAALKRLPRQLVLWTIPIVSVQKNADLHCITSGRVEDCASRIQRELLNA